MDEGWMMQVFRIDEEWRMKFLRTDEGWINEEKGEKQCARGIKVREDDWDELKEGEKLRVRENEIRVMRGEREIAGPHERKRVELVGPHVW